jgi:hypothetical protein
MTIKTFNKKFADSTIITGVRRANSDTVYLTGFYNMANVQTGYIYKGSAVDSNKGTFYTLSFPSSYQTSPYGPDKVEKDIVNVVGNYILSSGGNAYGFLYSGPYSNTKLGVWKTIMPPFEYCVNCIMHSTMNGICVGNYGAELKSITQVPLKPKTFAVLFNSKTNQYLQISIPNAESISAYGIWHNSGSSYTIAGGYLKNKKNRSYIVDWDESTNKFSNWTSYKYNNSSQSILTHFDGITAISPSVYNLTGDYIDGMGTGAFFCTVDRSTNKKPVWTSYTYPNSSTISGNTVIDNKSYGVYVQNSVVNGYVYINN